jgi:hypothetical protein
MCNHRLASGGVCLAQMGPKRPPARAPLEDTRSSSPAAAPGTDTHTHTLPLRHGLGEERGAAYLCMATWRSRSAAVALPVDALDMLGSR